MNTNNKTHESTNSFRTVIHTGWWGCGAYGNNRQMMLITQMLAAHWTQIDEIIFHTQTKEHENDIDAAKRIVEDLKNRKDVNEVIEEIVKLNLEWETSNDT